MSTPGSRKDTVMADYDRSTALVVVDVQSDFAHPEGSLHVPRGEEVVDVANREIRQAADAGATVVFTQDWHPPSTPHFAKDGGTWPVHCVSGSWGAQFADGLDVAGPVIRKGTGGEDGYSGFTVRDPATGTEQPTGLTDLLRAHRVERVVVIGLATDYCVKETALDAVREGFVTSVVEQGVRAVDREPGDGARALEEMARAGVTLVAS
jgi:nicotinamidase/pyrazinamidase